MFSWRSKYQHFFLMKEVPYLALFDFCLVDPEEENDFSPGRMVHPSSEAFRGLSLSLLGLGRELLVSLETRSDFGAFFSVSFLSGKWFNRTEILLKGLLNLNSTMQLYLFSGDSQEEVVEAVVADISSDDDDLMQRVKGQKVLATPAVRRIAKENKVNKAPGQLMPSPFVCQSVHL